MVLRENDESVDFSAVAAGEAVLIYRHVDANPSKGARRNKFPFWARYRTIQKLQFVRNCCAEYSPLVPRLYLS